MKHLPMLRVFVALLLWIGAGTIVFAQAPPSVTELVENLGHENYKVRQKASNDLAALVGKDKSLAAQLKTFLVPSTDPEVRVRLNKILATLPLQEWRFSKSAFQNEEWKLGQGGETTFDFLTEHTVRIDSLPQAKDYLTFKLPLPATNAVHRVVVSFELKIEAQPSDHRTVSGVMATVEDDTHQAWAFFWEQRVTSHLRPQSKAFDFTKDFVPVRMETVGDDYRVFVDGKKVIETSFGNHVSTRVPRSWVMFGDGTGGSSGRSVWRNVRVQLFER